MVVVMGEAVDGYSIRIVKCIALSVELPHVLLQQSSIQPIEVKHQQTSLLQLQDFRFSQQCS
jgi:hypothetical protein